MTTDFNSFDPNKVGQTSFGQHKGGKKAADNGQGATEAGNQGDPYADLKMDPSRLLDLLSAQARQNLPADLQNPSITNSISAFTNLVSPDRHARISRIFQQAYTEEFGQPPSDDVLENLVADYIIGRPVTA